MLDGALKGDETAMICHPDAAVSVAPDQNGEPQGSEQPLPTYQNCPCCLGLTLAGVLLDAPTIPKLAHLASKARTEDKAAESLGRHLLAPESRGPPQII